MAPLAALQLDGHVHRDSERRMDGTLHGVRAHDSSRAWYAEQVHRVCRVVPQQVVCPATRLPSAFMFDRRKKNVCTSICWILNSPPTILRWTH